MYLENAVIYDYGLPCDYKSSYNHFQGGARHVEQRESMCPGARSVTRVCHRIHSLFPLEEELQFDWTYLYLQSIHPFYLSSLSPR